VHGEPTPLQDETAVWQQLRGAGDPGARARLVDQYLPFARSLARRTYAMRADDSVPFADYLQYAHVGLLEALDRFDPSRGVPFAGFAAYRIKGAILSGLANESERAARREEWRRRVRERAESLAANTPSGAAEATLEDLAQITVGLALGVLMEQVAGEPLDDSVEANPYAAVELRELRAGVAAAVRTLPERERAILQAHYFERIEFRLIAASLRITKGRVAQLHAQALARLRAQLAAGRGFDRQL
jgi:RNA polymerase sigma factor FliA